MSRLSCLLVAVFVAGATATLQWPDTYTSTGQIALPYAEVSEPFYVAVDIPNKRSMTSTYDGKLCKNWKTEDVLVCLAAFTFKLHGNDPVFGDLCAMIVLV